MHHASQLCIRSHAFCRLAMGLLLLTGCTERQWPAIASLYGGDGEGIGGTGILRDEGIGGTGIIGVVSDFGSIIVNGLEIEFDDQTTVTIDEKRGTVDDLRRGQMVMVEATGPATSLVARAIAVRHEVAGPVTAIGPAPNELTVLDQRIMLADDAQGRTLRAVGDWVAVSGLRTPNGTIYGTRVDHGDIGGGITLHGRYDLREEAKRPVRIADLSIDGLSADSDLVGREVLLRGRLIDGRPVAAQLIPQSAEPFGGRVDGLSVAGFVDRQSGQTRLMGLPVTGLDEVPGLGRDRARSLGELLIARGRWLRDRQQFKIIRVGHRLDEPPPTPPWRDKTKNKNDGKSGQKGKSRAGTPGSSKSAKNSPGRSDAKGKSDRGQGEGRDSGGKGGSKGAKP